MRDDRRSASTAFSRMSLCSRRLCASSIPASGLASTAAASGCVSDMVVVAFLLDSVSASGFGVLPSLSPSILALLCTHSN